MTVNYTAVHCNTLHYTVEYTTTHCSSNNKTRPNNIANVIRLLPPENTLQQKITAENKYKWRQ